MKGVYGVAACAAIICSGVYAAPGVLKDTLACLNDDYKDLSLMHGGMASETRVIERMYDYGALGKRGDKIESKTITLVHKLFHRPPGSSGPAGFLVTKPLRELSNTKVAEFVASELVFFKRLPYEECFKQYQIKYKEFRSALVGGVGDKKIKQLEKSLGQARRALLTAFDTAPDHPPFESPLKELAHCPIKAFIECMDNEYMPATMPQTILQALLYKKTEGESTASRRAAFRTYYEWLDKRLDCLAYPLPVTWEQDFFSSDQREQLLAETKTLPAAQAYERWVFLNLSPTDYPTLVSYGDVTVQGVGFTDCMENTLRNVSNFLAYNQQTGLFDCGLFERRLGTQVHESVKRFYEQYADPATVAQKGAHNAWAEATTALPNHVYCRALPPISHQKKDCVKIEQETPVTAELCAKKGYVSLPAHTLAYDMRPLIKNFMLTCDYLFGLQLFKDLSVDTWARDGFITEQLPRVIDALKAHVPATLNYADLEYHDGTMIPAFVPLSFSFKEEKPYDFTVTLHIEHTSEYSEGELLFNQPPTPMIGLPPLATPRSDSQIGSDPVCALRGDSRLWLASASEIHTRSAENVLAWLFAQDLSDSTKFYALMRQVPIFNERILEVLLFSACKHTTGDAQTLQVLRIYQEALQRGLITCDAVVKTVLNEACIALRAKNTLVRGEALQLFKILCAHNKGVEAATSCAAVCLSSPDKKDISAGLSLLKVLVGEGKAFDDADKAAQSILNSLKPLPTGVRFEATQLYAQLMHHRDTTDTIDTTGSLDTSVGAPDTTGVGTTGAGESLRRKRISWEESSEDERAPVEITGERAKKKWAALIGLFSLLVYVHYKYVKNAYTSTENSKEKEPFLNYEKEPFLDHEEKELSLNHEEKEPPINHSTVADCGDTAVRTILNILSYNPATNRFDTSLLEQRLGVTVRQELARFYADNSDPASVSDRVVVTNWEQRVSCSIPLVVYDRAIINGMPEVLPADKRGFIKGVGDPAVLAVLIATGYVPVDGDAEVFVVKPTLKNSIVMLDYLLNLNLFEGELEHEFMREDFVATYLPQLATALHATTSRAAMQESYPLSLPLLAQGREVIV